MLKSVRIFLISHVPQINVNESNIMKEFMQSSPDYNDLCLPP